MTVAELIEKLNKCDPHMVVVVEHNDYGFEADWDAIELTADVTRGKQSVYVDYVSDSYSAPNATRERVIALTQFGHGPGFGPVTL